MQKAFGTFIHRCGHFSYWEINYSAPQTVVMLLPPSIIPTCIYDLGYLASRHDLNYDYNTKDNLVGESRKHTSNKAAFQRILQAQKYRYV